MDLFGKCTKNSRVLAKKSKKYILCWLNSRLFLSSHLFYKKIILTEVVIVPNHFTIPYALRKTLIEIIIINKLFKFLAWCYQ